MLIAARRPDFRIGFLKSQFKKLPYPTSNFESQCIIVTGANTGLGREAARHFVRLGAKQVILGVRSLEKGKIAQQDIEASTKRTGVVEIWEVDLTSYESVTAFCARADKLPRLDIVIENAAVAVPYFELAEGNELTMTVNVISTFLMALLLLPVLRRSSVQYNIMPRLTIVASDAHELANFPEATAPAIFPALSDPAAKNQYDRYPTSKLIEILIVRELGPLVNNVSKEGKGKIILNTLTPGLCHSDLSRNSKFPFTLVVAISKFLVARTTEVGSRTLVSAAVAGEESHGQYMADCAVFHPSKWVTGEKGAKAQGKVYAELMSILENIQPGVTGNI